MKLELFDDDGNYIPNPSEPRPIEGEPMSILYKGLNPKHHYGLCILTINGELITANGKHFQAIQIPKPHGRLIDASELIKSYMKGTKTDIDDFYDTIDIIDNAPTILEAEE